MCDKNLRSTVVFFVFCFYLPKQTLLMIYKMSQGLSLDVQQTEKNPVAVCEHTFPCLLSATRYKARGLLYPHTVALNRTPSSRLLPPFQRPPLSPLDRGAWQIDGKRCTIIAHYGLGWSAPIILKQSCLPGQGLCATWCRDRWGPLIKAGRGCRDWCGEIQMLMQHLED